MLNRDYVMKLKLLGTGIKQFGIHSSQAGRCSCFNECTNMLNMENLPFYGLVKWVFPIKGTGNFVLKTTLPS